MKEIRNSLLLIFASLKYDWRFLQSPFQKSLTNRLLFVIKKYLLITKHYLGKQPINLGYSRVKIGKAFLYYESDLGISGWQTMIVNFQRYYLPYIGRLARPVVVDIGAHVGFFALSAAYFLDKPTIYACEPLSLTYRLLKKNCRKERSIMPICIGFADRQTKAKLYYSQDSLGSSSLYHSHLRHLPKDVRIKSESVKLTTLDRFTEQKKIRAINILKIDAECAEKKILKGAKQTLQRTRFLIIECSVSKETTYTFSELLSLLISQTFNFQLVSIGETYFDQQGQLATVTMLLENLHFSPMS